MEAATLALEAPSQLAAIWAKTSAGQVRASHIHTAFEGLGPVSRQRLLSVEQRTQSNDITVFTITSREPSLELEAASDANVESDKRRVILLSRSLIFPMHEGDAADASVASFFAAAEALTFPIHH